MNIGKKVWKKDFNIYTIYQSIKDKYNYFFLILFI